MLENGLGYSGWLVDGMWNERLTNTPLSDNKFKFKKYLESFDEGRHAVELKKRERTGTSERQSSTRIMQSDSQASTSTQSIPVSPQVLSNTPSISESAVAKDKAGEAHQRRGKVQRKPTQASKRKAPTTDKAGAQCKRRDTEEKMAKYQATLQSYAASLEVMKEQGHFQSDSDDSDALDITEDEGIFEGTHSIECDDEESECDDEESECDDEESECDDEGSTFTTDVVTGSMDILSTIESTQSKELPASDIDTDHLPAAVLPSASSSPNTNTPGPTTDGPCPAAELRTVSITETQHGPSSNTSTHHDESLSSSKNRRCTMAGANSSASCAASTSHGRPSSSTREEKLQKQVRDLKKDYRNLEKENANLRVQLAAKENKDLPLDVIEAATPPRAGKVGVDIARIFKMEELHPDTMVYVHRRQRLKALAKIHSSYSECARFLGRCFFSERELAGMNHRGKHGKSAIDPDIRTAIVEFCQHNCQEKLTEAQVNAALSSLFTASRFHLRKKEGDL
ncbi:uncharacterized protein [Ptychodera flava]|uniref:uncharacterized protein n=1 Tax=Ptychodera flava TaxID=63121 RepID=UPI00396AA780